MTSRFSLRTALLAVALLGTTLASATTVAANDDADGDGIIDANDTVDTSGSTNVSLDQPATQSSDWNSTLTADKAVDGTLTESTGYAHTRDGEPWWEVDLGRMHTIEGINIWNRISCCRDRIVGAVVMIGAHPYGDMTLEQAEQRSVWSTTIESDDLLFQIDVPTRLGRYVRIQLPPTATPWLHMTEVGVMGWVGRPNDLDADYVIDAEDTVDNNGVVVSTGQPATQSSVSAGLPNAAGPEAAVDDVRDGGRDGSIPVALTDDDEPWWEVDLGGWYSIDGLNIYNRNDAETQGLLDGANVLFGDAPFGDVALADAQAAASWTSTITGAGALVQLDVPDRLARYVRLQLPPGGGEALGLAEVDVIASNDPDTGDIDNDGIPNGSDLYITGTNVALNQPATQSSDWSGTLTADKAVNGDLTQSTGYAHTRDDEPWWDVDLGAEYTIDGINLFNRINCCRDRLVTAEVLISATPFGDITLAQARTQAVWSGTVDDDGLIHQYEVPDAVGRYVRVQLPPAATDWLHFTEIHVSGQN
ncbi:MAG: discoidin domain-containing protein [Actinomycetota bacterium]